MATAPSALYPVVYHGSCPSRVRRGSSAGFHNATPLSHPSTPAPAPTQPPSPAVLATLTPAPATGSHPQPVPHPPPPSGPFPTQGPRRNSEPAVPRPLCLDFLNGKCGRHRALCRYYHPQPGEVTLVVPPHAAPDTLAPVTPPAAGHLNGPPHPICEVWALTGFCKYGPRCWKRHPQRAAQLISPIDMPITH
eukprot:EG_transcript_32933